MNIQKTIIKLLNEAPEYIPNDPIHPILPNYYWVNDNANSREVAKIKKKHLLLGDVDGFPVYGEYGSNSTANYYFLSKDSTKLVSEFFTDTKEGNVKFYWSYQNKQFEFKGINRFFIFNFFLKKFNSIESDIGHTLRGIEYWIKLITEANSLGKKIYIRMNPGAKPTLLSNLKNLKRFWKLDKYRNQSFIISN